MITVLFVIFILSLSAMAYVVNRKVNSMDHTNEKEVVAVVIPHPHHIRSMLKDGLKEGVHIIMMGIAKGWMFLGKSFKGFLLRHFPKVYDVFYGKPSTEINHGSSFFLSTIAEYKVKMKRLKDKMKKEEKIKKNGDGEISNI